MEFESKTRKQGNTIVITIPKKVRDAMKITVGRYVHVDLDLLEFVPKVKKEPLEDQYVTG